MQMVLLAAVTAWMAILYLWLAGGLGRVAEERSTCRAERPRRPGAGEGGTQPQPHPSEFRFICPSAEASAGKMPSNETGHGKGGRRGVLFVQGFGNPKFGSQVMRGTMLAAVLDVQPGWWSRPIPLKSLFGYRGPSVAACVMVKATSGRAVDHCRRLGAIVVMDVIDNMDLLRQLRKGGLMKGVDLYLTSSLSLATAIETRCGSTCAAAPLLHQHSNRGWRVEAPHQPFACQVSILTGETAANMRPNGAMQVGVASGICASGKVAAVVYISQAKWPGERSVYRCQEASDEMRVACNSSKPVWEVEPRDSTTCFAKQDRFNGDPSLQGTDLGLLWMPSFTDSNVQDRPWTRMLFWMSHGVPVTHYPVHGYLEAATELGYRPPGNRSLLIAKVEDLAEVVGGLAGSLADRLALRKLGFAIGENYSTTGVGLRLLGLLARQLNARSNTSRM